MKVLALALAVAAASIPRLPLRVPTGGPWCCLCACGSHDETRCDRFCLVRQRGHRVIQEPEIKTCTLKCVVKFKKETR
jgi:hypothetical protein